MIYMIMVLISIALFAIFMTAGVNSINIDSVYQRGHKSEISMALPSLATALGNYKMATGIYPDPLTDWKSTLFPDFGKYPEGSFSGTYSFDEVAGGINVCLELQNTQRSRDIATSLSSSDLYLAGHSCGTDEVLDSVSPVIITLQK